VAFWLFQALPRRAFLSTVPIASFHAPESSCAYLPLKCVWLAVLYGRNCMDLMFSREQIFTAKSRRAYSESHDRPMLHSYGMLTQSPFSDQSSDSTAYNDH
jgi:hypothetical protein